MSTKQKPSRADKRARKTTDVVTAAERDEAIQELIRGGQYAAVKNAYFCEHGRDLPIAGTPRPRPCPFCQQTECFIAFKNADNGHASAHVECEVCGVEGPYASTETDEELHGHDRYYALALKAAQLWNDREGAFLAELRS